MKNALVFLSLLALLLLVSCNSAEPEAPLPIPPENFELYVSDAATPSKIFKYDGNGSNGQVFANQNMAWTQDIVFLEDQKVMLVSNLTSGEIARYDISTGAFMDMFATGLAGPTRMKIGKDNLLYILQWNGDGRVLRYKLDGTFVDVFTSTNIKQSIGLDWDTEGNLYVSSYNSGSGGFVHKFGPAGNDLGRFITKGLVGPTNIWFDAEGNLLVVDYNSGGVKKFTSDGTYVATVINGLSQPEGVTFLDEGFILVGNGGTGSVKMYDKDYRFIKDLVTPGLAGLVRPNAVAIRKK